MARKPGAPQAVPQVARVPSRGSTRWTPPRAVLDPPGHGETGPD